MKPYIFLFTLFLTVVLVCCKNATNQNASFKTISVSGKSVDFKFMQSVIRESEDNPKTQSPDLYTIKKQIGYYQKYGIVVIPIAEKMINRCIGSMKEAEKDSLYLWFNEAYFTTINTLTDSLEGKYSGVIKKIDNKINDSETQDFRKCLDLCGASLFVSEGIYYADTKPDYFYKLFKNKISNSLDDFLKIRSKELQQGYSEDAGLLISFKELYDRVITWEDFRSQYPDFFMKDVAQYYYEEYLSTLLTGLSNTPTFDIYGNKLSPEVRKLYEQVIAKNGSGNSSLIIKAYYNLLKRTNFKQPENLDEFLKSKGLHSMLGVQSDTR